MGSPLNRKTRLINRLIQFEITQPLQKLNVHILVRPLWNLYFLSDKSSSWNYNNHGPGDKYHVGSKHPPDYRGRAFPVILQSGKRRSLPLSRFSQRLRPAPSSSTWDVWAGVDGLSCSASLSAVEERTFTGRLQEKTQNADEIDIEMRNCTRRRRISVCRQRTV